MTKGSMQLMFSPQEADALYAKMGPGQEVSGGSAANTVAGIAALGGRCGFIGQVADDELGRIFTFDINNAGITLDTAVRAGEPSTARCLIFVRLHEHTSELHSLLRSSYAVLCLKKQN